jgi:hypothetical protein
MREYLNTLRSTCQYDAYRLWEHNRRPVNNEFSAFDTEEKPCQAHILAERIYKPCRQNDVVLDYLWAGWAGCTSRIRWGVISSKVNTEAAICFLHLVGKGYEGRTNLLVNLMLLIERQVTLTLALYASLNSSRVILWSIFQKSKIVGWSRLPY